MPAVRTTRSKAAPKTVEVVFSLPADVEADTVALCGDFNDWAPDTIALVHEDDRSWKTTLSLPRGQAYRYRYLLDGERWENAWQADDYVPNPFGSDDSVIVVA